jgi:hypothetical protein
MHFHHPIEIAPISDYDNFTELLRKIYQKTKLFDRDTALTTQPRLLEEVGAVGYSRAYYEHF